MISRLARRLYHLHHRLRYWLDSLDDGDLGRLALAAMLFLFGCIQYMDALRGW